MISSVRVDISVKIIESVKGFNHENLNINIFKNFSHRKTSVVNFFFGSLTTGPFSRKILSRCTHSDHASLIGLFVYFLSEKQIFLFIWVLVIKFFLNTPVELPLQNSYLFSSLKGPRTYIHTPSTYPYTTIGEDVISNSGPFRFSFKILEFGKFQNGFK
jgi:hypothetical protein